MTRGMHDRNQNTHNECGIRSLGYLLLVKLKKRLNDTQKR